MKQVVNHKQLVVTFYEKMNFNNHIRDNCKKAMNRITALKRLHGKLPRSSKLTIYTTFIRPVLEFGWQLYINSSHEQLDSLEKVQREGLLLITSAYKKTSHQTLLYEVGIPLLANRRQMQKIQFIYKHYEKLIPPYLENLIPNTVQEVTNYNLRNKDDIMLPKSKKNYFLKSFIPSSIKTWNEANMEIRQAASYDALKAKLKNIYAKKSPCLFLRGDTKESINHSRMRMGLSALKAQRKKYHFIADSICDSCNARCETPDHFFLHCPTFVAQRQEILQELLNKVPSIRDLLLNYNQTRKLSNQLTQIFLFGTGKDNFDTVIFQIVQIYIKKSDRFV